MNAQANVTKAKRNARKTAEVSAPVVETVVTVDRAAAAQSAILDAIKARVASAPNDNFRKNMSAELNQFSGANAKRAIELCIELEIDFESLARSIAITEARNADYVAIYALQKVRKAVFALAQKSRAVFDGYSHSIIHNIVSLQALTNKTAQMSICKSIEFSELEQVQAIKRYKECTPSTASTQASSTRQMLRFLNICTVVKNKKDDSIALTESKAAQAVQSIFSA
ncbi:hypothetical protein [Paraburkholderia sp.]|uniref:hypothetical protein n=1 Tax=Paraburkholderia sp. TaxID=1926495 RepID=UPI0039E46050